jgi:hypothetical protein
VHLGSLNLPLALLIALGIAIAFAATISAPIIAIPIFIVLFGGFLFWRGARRTRSGPAREQRVPSTEEASADPVRDSAAADVGPIPERPGASAQAGRRNSS